jgi:phosphatidylglycerol:prolipoprotein diacylglycerol transferase
MYPYELFFGIDLYTCFVAAGVISALVTLRILSAKLKISDRLYNFTLINGTASILFGLFSAVLFQSLYNVRSLGKFELGANSGATFMGGLAGGAFLFLIVYFVLGKLVFKDKENIKELSKIADIGVCCISIAHAFGRVGCLMAGCCYGKREEGILGIYNHAVGYKTLPVQLFEAILLFGLFVLMLFLLKKGISTYPVYLVCYPVWRFFAEYLRDDERGQTFVSAITPSQLLSIVMLAVGIALIVAKIVKRKKQNEKNTP